MLLAGLRLPALRGTIRSALGRAEASVRGSAQLARVAFAGAITGMAGMAMAIVIISSADDRGCRREPRRDARGRECVGRAFPRLCHGLRCVPHARWLLTLRSGVFARWTGVVALIGAVSFLVTFAAVLSGLGEDSLFGFGFFPGVLALVIWSIATSIGRYRALASAPTSSA